MINVDLVFSVIQCLVGVAITLSAYVIAALGMDDKTHFMVRWPMVGLVGWGAWFALVPWTHGHDSLAAIALGLLVAFVLIIYGRQVRGILDGEAWWPGRRLLTRAENEVHP